MSLIATSRRALVKKGCQTPNLFFPPRVLCLVCRIKESDFFSTCISERWKTFHFYVYFLIELLFSLGNWSREIDKDFGDKERGLSLSEMMIGLLLASIILSVLMQHYLQTKQQYSHSQELLEHAFELQLVRELIRDSVHRAGFTPCLNINLLKTFDARNGNRNLVGLTVSSKKLPRLEMKRMGNPSVVKGMDAGNSLIVTSKSSLVVGQTILIADCYSAEVQQISCIEKSQAGWKLKLKTPLVFSFDLKETYIGEWVEEAFFVQNNQHHRAALFYQRDHPEELTPLINKIQVTRKIQGDNRFVQVLLSGDKVQEMVVEVMVRTG